MPVAKPIQLILARQLASGVATPILLVDREGTLVFFNEPAEALLGRRFDETGEIAPADWNAMIAVADESRNALAPDEWPTRAALRNRRPVSRTIWTRSAGGPWRHLQVTAVPLVGDTGELLGAINIFWEIAA